MYRGDNTIQKDIRFGVIMFQIACKMDSKEIVKCVLNLDCLKKDLENFNENFNEVKETMIDILKERGLYKEISITNLDNILLKIDKNKLLRLVRERLNN